MRSWKIELRDWRVEQYDPELPDETAPESSGDDMEAAVPGCVQYDLVRHGKLENPYGGTQAAFDAAWVAKSDWLYETEFDAPDGAGAYGAVFLKLWGVDTFSEVWLNGELLGKTADAYKSYELLIGPSMLQKSHNKLQIRVQAHGRMIADKIEAAGCLKRDGQTEGLLGKSLIRRYQRSFFTNSSLLNVGTGVLGIGINRPVELYFYPGAYLEDLSFATIKLSGPEMSGPEMNGLEMNGLEMNGPEMNGMEISGRSGQEAVCLVRACVKNAGPGTKLKLELLEQDGTCVWNHVCEIREEELELPVSVPSPKLWQPVGCGTPYLYTLKAVVLQDGAATDEKTIQTGIRAVEIVQRAENGTKTFYIAVNGRKIQVHGQNYIPFDYLKVYGTREQYENMFTLLENSHVNLIRVWGGGAVEDDSFFRECDRRGILIWHDLFLHSNVYPDYDPEFVREYLEEARGVLKTIRSHPCICLVCGGNEQQEGWDEWGWQQELERFYGDSLPLIHTPRLMKELCPELPYIYNSPHGGRFSQSPVEGECHCWGNYYNSFKDPLFVSETCWTTESYSRPETLEKYMGIRMEEFEGRGWAERWNRLTSLPLVNRRPFSSWFDVRSLKGYLHALELEQARADYNALSQFRFTGPSNNGVIYWSFNKGGPLFQFGCVDYGGRPMMSYYVVKRLYGGIAVFPYRDVRNVRVMLSNHLIHEETVSVEAFHMNEKGNVLEEFRADMICRPGELLAALDLENLYSRVADRTKETVFVRAVVDGSVVSEDLLLFCPYGELELEQKPVRASLERTGDREWELTVVSEGVVQMVEIECGLNIVCGDNYFPMMAGQEKKITVTALEPMDPDRRQVLHVGRLGDEETMDLEM